MLRAYISGLKGLTIERWFSLWFMEVRCHSLRDKNDIWRNIERSVIAEPGLRGISKGCDRKYARMMTRLAIIIIIT